MRSRFALAGWLLALSVPLQANDSPLALQQAFMSALRANDAAGLAACYADDAVNFLVGSMMGRGPASVEETWSGFFAAYRVEQASLAEEHLEMHGDTAIAWGLFTILARPIDGGEPVAMHGRYMDVARKLGGRWLYVADHASLPAIAAEAEDAGDGQ